MEISQRVASRCHIIESRPGTERYVLIQSQGRTLWWLVVRRLTVDACLVAHDAGSLFGPLCAWSVTCGNNQTIKLRAKPTCVQQTIHNNFHSFTNTHTLKLSLALFFVQTSGIVFGPCFGHRLLDRPLHVRIFRYADKVLLAVLSGIPATVIIGDFSGQYRSVQKKADLATLFRNKCNVSSVNNFTAFC